MSNRTARIEIVPTQANCAPHADWEECSARSGEPSEPCWRYLPLSYLRHHLRLVAGNGLTLASSEEYQSRAGARRALVSWERAFCEAFDARPEGQPQVVVLDIDGNPIP